MLGLTTWFTIGTLGMVVGTAMLAYGLRLVPTERRQLLAWMAAVPGIAAVAYALMALGVGGLTGGGGTSVFVPRYVDWLLTTPIHVAVVAAIAGAPRRLIARLAGLQAATIVLGLAGALVGPPLNWALYLLGAAVFAVVVYLLYVDAEALAAENSDDVAALFRKLRSFVVVLWLVYPVIWALSDAGVSLMDAETTALVVTYIDVVAKVGFGLIAINDFVSIAATREDAPDPGQAPASDGASAAD
jgi:sensory rhodopsin